jgi:hypothetical protein
MENFGILLAIPATLVASTVYCLGAAILLAKVPRLRRVALAGSFLVVLAILVEIILLVALGAKTSYIRLGVGFAVMHYICFWLGPPAVANLVLILLSHGFDTWKPWRIVVAVLACWFVCMPTVVVNIVIDEQIVGINGEGPFYLVDPSSLTQEQADP